MNKEANKRNRIGLALGGGGARGFAHIRFLEVLDELQIRPSIVAGCSMGAVVGALYASGQSGAEIRQLVEQYAPADRGTLRESWQTVRTIFESLKQLGPEFRRSGLVNVDKLLERLLEPLVGKTFADLEIPLVVVATDFWRAEEVVLDSGDLLAAIRASISVPGLISPQKMNGRVLVDGGLTNELPFEHLRDRCDTTIAISVAGTRDPESRKMPSSLEASAGAIDILQKALLQQKLTQTAPDILVCPEIQDIELLDLAKVQDVFAQCESSVSGFRSDMCALMQGPLSSEKE